MKKSFIGAMLLTLAIGTAGFAQAAEKSTYFVEDGKNVAAKTIYEYKPDSLFQVNTQIGYLTDIEFHPGETITYVGAGDTTRWILDQSTVGNVTHLYIKPIREDIVTNMIVNTNAHTYRFWIVSSADSYTPIIHFSFPQEETAARYAKPMPIEKDMREFLDIFTDQKGNHYIPKKINRKYLAKKHGKVADELYPEEIFDDGIRTYIKMPLSNKYDMPVLYDVKPDKTLTLINYRMRGSYMIADKVFTSARLVFAPKIYLEITEKDKDDHYRNDRTVDYSTKKSILRKEVKEDGDKDSGATDGSDKQTVNETAQAEK